MKKRILYLIVAGLMVSLAFMSCNKDDDSSSNDDYTKSDLYGTWKGSFDGLSVTIEVNSSGWSLSSSELSDHGTYTFNGNGGSLRSTVNNYEVGTWSFVNKNAIKIKLSEESGMAGTYTLTREGSSNNDEYTQSDLYGTWKGTFEGVSVTVVTTASNNWTLSSYLFSDYGTFTFTGSGGGLYSKQWNMNVGKWTFLSKTKITITLNSDTDYPGTYTLSKQ